MNKTTYKGYTIFEEISKGKKVYRTQSGISRTRFTSKAGAQKAIDKFIAKYKAK